MKSLRVASGLTQEQLARKLDVSVSTVRNWDAGRSFPHLSPAAMEDLAAALGTDLTTLAAAERAQRNG
jgi:transcriptional regulator with XRE-family HTH domain